MPQSKRRSLRPPTSGRRSAFGNRGYGPHTVRTKTSAADQVARKIIEAAEKPVIEVTVEAPVVVPTRTFDKFGLPEPLLNALQGANMTISTPIQDQTIELGLAGRDVVGLANTGTGKTAAFLLPILTKLLVNRNQQVLILAPTRELAQQIFEEFKRLSRKTGLRGVVVVGGMNSKPQLQGLRAGAELVIATPGRLNDFMVSKQWSPNRVHTVVLDEVDRILDIGFLRDLERILGALPSNRQSLFFSATMTPDIKQVIDRFSHDYETISVKSGETAASVKQEVVKVHGRDEKTNLLSDRLRDAEYGRVIVFGRTKHGVDRLTKSLRQRNFKVDSIHGNRSQGQRTRALDMFRKGKIQALIATDVAARGIDIPQVSHVINYDIPSTYDDYVHRIGRTGRAGESGHAVTFIEE